MTDLIKINHSILNIVMCKENFLPEEYLRISVKETTTPSKTQNDQSCSKGLYGTDQQKGMVYRVPTYCTWLSQAFFLTIWSKTQVTIKLRY